MTEPEQIFSVSDLTSDLRFTLEGRYNGIWVEGEVSNHRLPGSGHHYFTLKDASAQLSCVLFKGNAMRCNAQLADGQQVQLYGNISVYEARGQYQLVAQFVQTKGAGQLQQQFEALKAKLHAEGLFDPAIKKPISSFPSTIGVVTSPTGAAIQDILNVLSRRAPWTRVLIYPAKVQGAGAAEEIAEGIRFFGESHDDIPEIDTLIIGRGGGSIEDLWSFNEEVVARAIHACPVPVISAVGHEIDFTIADFCADMRAPTPSAAAETAVPDGEEIARHLDVLNQRQLGTVQMVVSDYHRHLEALKREIEAREPHRQIENWSQSLDYLNERFELAFENRLLQIRSRVDSVGAVIKSWNPERDVDAARERVDALYNRLNSVVDTEIHDTAVELAHAGELLKAISPERTLERGFSMTLDSDGNPIKDADQVQTGQLLETHLAKGKIVSRAE
ncbi:MAG: exodeoxyribonuclease VII large subunit [Verrucomicrobiota bacterium]